MYLLFDKLKREQNYKYWQICYTREPMVGKMATWLAQYRPRLET